MYVYSNYKIHIIIIFTIQDPDASFDINGNDSDPTPQDNGDNKHGTRCAGEVAAVAFNNYCGVGVAYNASIGGNYDMIYNMILYLTAAASRQAFVCWTAR